jgi:hypothetical protein
MHKAKFRVANMMKDGKNYYVGFAKAEVNNGFVSQTVFGHEWTLDIDQAKLYYREVDADNDVIMLGNGAYKEPVFFNIK